MYLSSSKHYEIISRGGHVRSLQTNFPCDVRMYTGNASMYPARMKYHFNLFSSVSILHPSLAGNEWRYPVSMKQIECVLDSIYISSHVEPISSNSMLSRKCIIPADSVYLLCAKTNIFPQVMVTLCSYCNCLFILGRRVVLSFCCG